MSVTTIVFIGLLTLVYMVSTSSMLSQHIPEKFQAASIFAVEARPVNSPFYYTFNSNGTLNETGSMDQSSSPYFWLNSGGRLYIKDGIGMTIQGPVEKGLIWQLLYAKSSSVDTAGGYYPQNLFRLLTRSKWGNASEEVKFNIANINLTDTPNRDGYSGILLMTRYQDGSNLYYAGIRMDGKAIIKKKYKGTYYTLASKTLPWATSQYNKTTNPNLIPEDKWMRLKVDTVNAADGSVQIKLQLDENNDGKFEEILSATDKPGVYGAGVLSAPGYTGIRTDYSDVLFDNFIVRAL